jgi:predicted ATPase
LNLLVSSAVYIVEDTHWIDEVSESMIAEFLTVIPQTPSLVLVTYRPEYRGALTRVTGAQTVALAPLSDSETATLVSELLGHDPSVRELGQKIARGPPVIRSSSRRWCANFPSVPKTMGRTARQRGPTWAGRSA